MSRPAPASSSDPVLTFLAILVLLQFLVSLPPAVASDQRRDDAAVGSPAVERHVEVGDELESAKVGREDATEIRFRNGLRLQPAWGIDASLTGPLQGTYLLQFSDRVRSEWLGSLKELGVTVHDHIQTHAMLVHIPPEASAGILQMVDEGAVRYVGPYPVDAKIETGLATESGEELWVTVLLVKGATEDARSRIREVLKVDAESESVVPFLRGWITSEQIFDIASLDDVKWIERYVPGVLHNLEAGMAGAADDVVALGVFTGGGVRVAVMDSGIARTGSVAECGGTGANYHADIGSSRIADEWDYFNSDSNACDDDAHGTHVAGTIGGDGTMLDTWAGIAPDVTFLIYKDCCDANGRGFTHFNNILSRAAANDADIIGNSWGSGNGNYNTNSQLADSAVRGAWNGSDGQKQYMFVTVSAGNENDLASPPSTGKNVVSVGAMKDGNFEDGTWCWGVNNCTSTPGCSCTPNPRCGDQYWPASERICFSDYGPIDSDGDGNFRVKPDIVAPGTRIMSTAAPHLMANPAHYRYSDGTSMSQPVIAGVAALMLDAYPENLNWPEKTKARLLGTAIDLGDRNQFGHGMVDALHAVFSSESMSTELWQGGAMSATGDESDYNFLVPAGFSEVRVYLAWTDADSATTEVVNDLDLRVYDGTGAQVGASAAFDDTVEYVRLSSGAPGTWRANVRGYNVPSPAAYFGIYAGVVLLPSSLSMNADPNGLCLRPGASFQVDALLQNSGHSVAASESQMDLPDDPNLFLMHNVEVVSSDPGRTNVYQAAEIHRDTPTNTYSVYLGSVHKTVPREARWSMQVGTGAADGSYLLIPAGSAVGHIYHGDVVDVQVDGTLPGSASNLLSTTHPAGTCFKQDYVWMSWDPAADTGCGLDGYSLLWSEGVPGLPPPVKQLEEGQSSYFEQLVQSTTPYYFNLRSVDNAGNWATSASSYGPMWVDYTPPGEVSSLASESHPAGACTDAPNVSMFWNPAPDDNCGLAGYSLLWSEFVPGMPDASQDVGPVTSHFDTLFPSNAPYYFNVRARDAGDNWANSYATYGPIWVDTIPGELGGLHVEAPGGDDLVFWWNVAPNADHYRVYKDTRPWFPAPTQINDEVQIPELWDVGGALDPNRVVYYQVVGTNICGAEGPM